MLSFLPRLFTRRKKSRRAPIRERFTVGRGTYGEPTVLQWGQETTLQIGSFCSIARHVTIILDGDHRIDWITTYPFMEFRDSAKTISGHPKSKGDVIIGHDVWLGYGSTILSGVHIGNGAVVAACSVVTKDVPAYGIVAGNPAKLIRYRFSEPEIQQLEELAWWNWSDQQIDAAMPLLLSENLQHLKKIAEKFID